MTARQKTVAQAEDACERARIRCDKLMIIFQKAKKALREAQDVYQDAVIARDQAWATQANVSSHRRNHHA